MTVVSAVPRHAAALVLTLLALVLTTGLLTAPAIAAGDSDTPDDSLTWSVRPAENEHGQGRPNFSYALEPGESITDAIVITNRSTTTLPLEVYAADGFTTPSGYLDLVPAGTPNEGLGAWVSTDADHLELAPGESAEVAFTLTVPADARPGDHPGGIVASYTSAGEQGNVRLDRRLGSRIQVRVGGETEIGLEVVGLRVEHSPGLVPFTSAPARVSYRLVNTGDVRAFAHESVTVSGLAGIGAVTLEARAPEIMPGDSLEREVVVDAMWPTGRVSGAVQVVPQGIDSAPGAAIEAQASAWSLPWTTLVVIVLIVAAGVLVLLRLRRARRKVAPEPPRERANVAIAADSDDS